MEQDRVFVPAVEHEDQEPQLHVSAVQLVGGVQDWLRAGLGVDTFGQSLMISHDRVCVPVSEQEPQEPQPQTS